VAEGVGVTILADRGFGDVKLFAFSERFGHVVRFRGNSQAAAANGAPANKGRRRGRRYGIKLGGQPASPLAKVKIRRPAAKVEFPRSRRRLGIGQ
jgi:hypothetical protein